MAEEKYACRKAAELILGHRLKDAPARDVLHLLVLGVCNIALVKADNRTKKKRVKYKNTLQISNLLYREVMRRMCLKK